MINRLVYTYRYIEMLFRSVWLNILRRHTSTLLVVGIAAICALFLGLYSNMIAVMQQDIDDLCSDMSVTADITNKAGTRSYDLRIVASAVDELLTSGLCETQLIWQWFVGMDGYRDEHVWKSVDMGTHGIQNLTLVTANHPLAIIKEPEKTITFMDGYSLDDLSSNQPVCAIEKNAMETRGLKLGDTISLTIYQWNPEIMPRSYYRIDQIDYTIIGIINQQILLPGRHAIEAYVPLSQLRKIYQEQGKPFYYGQVQLRLTNPLLINRFTQTALETGFSETNLTADPNSTRGYSIVISDEIFVNAVTPLLRNINLFSQLFPLIFSIIALIGGIVSYLLINNRRGEIAICRTLGMDKVSLVIILLCENFLPCFVGIILALAILLPLVTVTQAMIQVHIAFLVFYMFGCTIAVLLINRDNIVHILTNIQ